MISPTNGSTVQFLLLGASAQNANRGVSALAHSTIFALKRAFPSAKLVVCESGVDLVQQIRSGENTIQYETCWLNAKPGIAGRSRIQHLKWLHRIRKVVPGLGTRWLRNRTYRQILESDVVFDLSGGDSFSDIYGIDVFRGQCFQKQFVLDFDKPLVLLPQTLGPFSNEMSVTVARNILRKASIVATREQNGLKELQNIFETSDPKYVFCPDLAISLPPSSIPNFGSFIEPSERAPLIGINVSGLLWRSNINFSMASNYRDLVWKCLEWCISIPNSRILLIPHVFNDGLSHAMNSTEKGLREYPEHELAKDLAKKAMERWGARVLTIDRPYTAPELKWIIGLCEFFIGARMHSCIAGLSQCVPTVVLAYSKKAEGVLGSLEAQDLVIDLRVTNISESIRRIQEIFDARDRWREYLQPRVLDANRKIEYFFENVLPHAFSNIVRAQRTCLPSK